MYVHPVARYTQSGRLRCAAKENSDTDNARQKPVVNGNLRRDPVHKGDVTEQGTSTKQLPGSPLGSRA